MIGKREILDVAATVGLNPHVVEKDYALGWALAGIFAHPELAESWVFKGGTCLKKCYFETYRFSEDLDFTVLDPAHLDGAFLKRVFREISAWIYERTGLEFPAQSQDFEIFANPRGNPSCQGKLSYRGPVSSSSGGLPRVKLDLTADERIVLAPVRVPIFHPYSDAPADGITVLSYAYEEAFGEKVRALAERTRPRDLYDVVNLYRNTEARPSPSVLMDVLRQKCAFKGIEVPRAGDLDGHKGALEGAWQHMLGHQLPALPPVDAFWDVLPEFFGWLEEACAPAIPAAYVSAAGDTVIREPTLRLPLRASSQAALEIIRFAAANRDPRHFECPHEIDLERKNAGSHLGFSSGTHHCLGAPLARRELYWGFKAFVDRIDEVWLAPGKNDLRHLPNYHLRILKELHIEFTPAKR